MTQGKRRAGRPLSKATIDRRNSQSYWGNRPSYLPARATNTPTLGEILLRGLIEGEKVALGPYRHGRWTPDSHAYAMLAMLEDGAQTERMQELLSDDELYRVKAARRRKEGGRTTKLKSDRRRDALLAINAVLISKLGTRPYTRNKVAGMIHNQWSRMTDAQRLQGEPKTMKCRGDGGPILSAGHIARWLRALV
jgi:hypothetical protein